MTDHCFISYSNADGLIYASQLANELQGRHPNINVWFDKNNLDAGQPWDTQIAEAIRACKCFLFVMTNDSVTDNSVCKDEWTWALKYKKSIIPLHFHPKADLPFRLNNLQFIEFSRDFNSGIARLRDRISNLDSPQGILDQFKRRLADANRDLHRASDEDQPRIRAEMDELTEQIRRQEEILKNPNSAARRTDLSIGKGIDEERKVSKTVTTHGNTKVINTSIFVPSYFQDRIDETKQIADFIQNDSFILMTVMGRGGIGKSALVYRLLQYLENGILPDNLGNAYVNGIIYLRETGGHEINFPTLYNGLSQFLSPEKAAEAEAAFKVPKQSIETKMHSLLGLFEEGKYIILLDNFDQLIDIETEGLHDMDLDSALRAFLLDSCQSIKILITTRNAPHNVNLFQPGRQKIMSIDEGLPSPYAEEMLRALDSNGDLGLKFAPDTLLHKARALTLGYPRALEALFGILAADRYTGLEEILLMPLPHDVVSALVGEAFSRLDATAQKVMQALSVFNRPVTAVSIDYLLQPLIAGIDSKPILERLVAMHFAKRSVDRYYLHPSDQKYAFEIIPLSMIEAKKGNDNLNIAKYWNRKFLLRRAGDFFQQIRKSPPEWKGLEDLNANMIEYEYRLAGEEYDKAAEAINEATESDYLNLWGYYKLILDLQEPLSGHLKDSMNIIRHKNSLGNAYFELGLFQQAIAQYEEIPMIPAATSRTNALALTFSGLANCYEQVCEWNKALTYLNKALPLTRQIKDRRGEGGILTSLGHAYSELGEVRKAIEFYNQVLVIARGIGNRQGEEVALGGLGNAHADLGDARKAIEFYEQALIIDREIGDRRGESVDLQNIGNAWLSISEYQEAEENYQLAIQIADKISFSQTRNHARWGLAEVYLSQIDFVNARATIEAALQYDVPKNNHNSSALHGIIALRQGDEVIAHQAFTRAIAQADEILAKTPEYYNALDAKGLALCGLAICDDNKYVTDAIETFRAARKIAPHAGIVKRVLRLFDELVKCDKEGILKDVKNAVEGKE